MSGNLTNRLGEIDQIFGRALPWVESALSHQYGLPPEDLTDMEACLHDWFLSFARRPGSPHTDERLRPHLMLMTCQAGHVYWAGKLPEKSLTDENVKRSLTLGPQQIAIELEKQIKKSPGSDEGDGGREGS